MDGIEIWLGVMAVTLLGATIHAWRMGNEKRDVAFLGTTSALCGAGAAVAALL